MQISNILSIDIEDKLQAPSNNIEDELLFDYCQIEDCILETLELLNNADSKATFFISGKVAKGIEKSIKQIVDSGHEVASHGMCHKLVYNMNEEEFRKDLLESLDILTEITGVRPIGYRAPYNSITSKSLWALRILSENGIKYDSSIFPTKNYLYGIPGFSRFPLYLKEYSMYEFPGSTFRLAGNNIPFGGGFYLRAMPYWLTKFFITNINSKGQSCSVYFHPHELRKVRYPVSLLNKENFILNFGKYSLRKKITFLLNNYKFVSFKKKIEELFKNGHN